MAKRVLIQAGHIAPREPGFEGGTGTVREQELNRAIRARLVALLKKDKRFKPIPQPGDLTNVPCEAALFLHGDGSTNKAASGRSFGFPEHAVNRKLAVLLEKHLAKIPGAPPEHAWNYTGGLRFYYGYSRIGTAGPEVLIEHGFLTNPAEQKWLFKHLAEQATAEYRALCEFFGLKPIGEVKPKRLGWIVEWTDAKGKRRRRRRITPMRLVDRLWADGLRRRILVRREQPIPPST
jgi:hypothetical protein